MQTAVLAQPKLASPNTNLQGITIDFTGSRVKALFSEIFEDEQTVREYLREKILASNEAMNILRSLTSRFACKIIAPRNQITKISPFGLTNDLIVKEEARISNSDFDVIYIGGNGLKRFEYGQFRQEYQLATKCVMPHPRTSVSSKASFRQLTSVSNENMSQLLEIYRSCFRSRLVPLDEGYIRSAVQNSIFYVARNSDGVIMASAMGEIIQLGPLTLFEISKVVSHPKLRIRGVATECTRLVVEQGKNELHGQVITFMEARMWTNILHITHSTGLTNFAGICHQHCSISSPEEMISIPQTQYHSLAIYYLP